MTSSVGETWLNLCELMLMLMVPAAVLLTVRYLNRHDETDESVAVVSPADAR